MEDILEYSTWSIWSAMNFQIYVYNSDGSLKNVVAKCY